MEGKEGKTAIGSGQGHEVTQSAVIRFPELCAAREVLPENRDAEREFAQSWSEGNDN